MKLCEAHFNNDIYLLLQLKEEKKSVVKFQKRKTEVKKIIGLRKKKIISLSVRMSENMNKDYEIKYN